MLALVGKANKAAFLTATVVPAEVLSATSSPPLSLLTSSAVRIALGQATSQ
jgi:hypothetical protein